MGSHDLLALAIRVAYGGGLVLLFLTLVLFLVVLALSLIRRERQRQQARFLARWSDFVLGFATEPWIRARLHRLPTLPPGDRRRFLELWVDLQETSEAQRRRRERTPQAARYDQRLNLLACVLRVNDYARWLLQYRRASVLERLLAVIALGRLREQSALPDLHRLSLDSHPALSLAAARAVLQIDPTTVHTFLKLLSERDDWSLASVESTLQDIGPEQISGPLCEAVRQALPDAAPRLIRCLAFCEAATALSTLAALLAPYAEESTEHRAGRDAARDDSFEVIAAGLHVLGQLGVPEATSLVRPFAAHPHPAVRVQATIALGRLGSATDEGVLLELLSDSEWWVRYRAAEALSRLPSVSAGSLARLREQLTDRYARDSIQQAIAERQLATSLGSASSRVADDRLQPAS